MTSGSTLTLRDRVTAHPWRAAAAAVVAAAVVLVGAPTAWVQLSPGSRVHTVEDVPDAPVALVLGAGLRPDGTPSPFLSRRLDLARELYDQGRVRAILVSGDNSRAGHGEPTAMQAWLVEHGIPADAVVLDYAGFDTHDTCVRAHEVFGVDRAVVITQDYHLRRALFSCGHAGIDATGVAASSTTQDPRSLAMYRLREVPASVRAALDAVPGRQPVHLGPHEPGVEDALARSAG
ncbi:SanA/YdcF family protein [Cellulomonas timonensis]|uniref:SanA/YdcF family protein n=1 Tax=Cellulomonas timonensis TaxID=1689271 RepID=UPI0009ED4A70|nr:ElyC/SanA/YdcF family protein [Cellulomonas timonensis]